MARKHDVNDIKLQINEVEFFYNDETEHGGMIIRWSSSIGFGEYTILQESDGRLHADTEMMDDNEDKSFGRKLMELLMDEVKVLM